jgi:para-nitrobenzyl esterase
VRFKLAVIASAPMLAGVASAASGGYSRDAQAAADTAMVVATLSGVLRGAIGSTTVTFLGIPYAEAPVGELRWRPPRPRDRWAGVLDALQFGKHCPQP